MARPHHAVRLIEVQEIDRDEGVLIASFVEPPQRELRLPAAFNLVVGDRALVRLARGGVELVRKLPRAQTILGKVERSPKGFVVEPIDGKRRERYMLTRLDGAKDGDLVRVRIAAVRRHANDLARVVEVLGPATGPHAASILTLAEHDIPIEIPADAVAEAERARPAPMDGRADLRQTPFVTIDGEDARDFDDAVAATPEAHGFTLQVAIADVAWYVRPDSPLDRAALERGNSVYLPDRAIPMLPEKLSNDLCSLRPDEDRAVLVMTARIDAQGKLLDHRFARAMIRSIARLTYDQAQHAIDGRVDAVPAAVLAPLRRLYDGWAALRHARRARAPLDLDLTERKVVFGPTGIVGVVPRARFDSHRLIEDYMILANVAAAETLTELRLPCLYRQHAAPDPVRLEALRAVLESLGRKLPKGQTLNPGQFNAILEWAATTPYRHLVNDMVLRTQSLAIYGPEDRGHFGLALRRYAHFTSPIRRYADLIVHRAIIQGRDLGPGGLHEAGAVDLTEIAGHLSLTERRAAAAERGAVDRYVAAFLADRVGATFHARVSGVQHFGLFVTLDDLGADGLIPLALLPADHWRHDERAQSLVGRKASFRLGDAVEVKLERSDPTTGRMTFSLLAGAARPALTRSGPRRAGKRKRGRV